MIEIEFVVELSNNNLGRVAFYGITPRYYLWRFALFIYGDDMSKHGHSILGKVTKTYTVWVEMKGRCNNPKNKSYKDYGGRGIKVCQRWDDFRNFLTDMGERPDGLMIDRINNDGNYEPGNCQWTDITTSNRNTRRVKLSMKKANKIRRLYSIGIPELQIAKMFNVHRRTVNNIKNNINWKI